MLCTFMLEHPTTLVMTIGQWRTLSVYADGGVFGIDLCVNRLSSIDFFEKFSLTEFY